jgi:hypothetical protein
LVEDGDDEVQDALPNAESPWYSGDDGDGLGI